MFSRRAYTQRRTAGDFDVRSHASIIGSYGIPVFVCKSDLLIHSSAILMSIYIPSVVLHMQNRVAEILQGIVRPSEGKMDERGGVGGGMCRMPGRENGEGGRQ